MSKAASLMAILLLAGCAGMTAQKGLIVTGESLKAVGNQFVDVAATFKEGCDVTKTIGQPDCQRFAIFGAKFKSAYPVAVQLWERARAAGDAATQDESEKLVRQLARELSSFAVFLIQSFGGKQ